ncbi:pyruvate dehydrogenase E2 component (dihydrolipoamide acetyltransferase) [Anseongella ginsenosidimutans]|uniref:Acetyltransferase component of pyruvate dehydrogenase complex n=1 Tax=Anseongella ginsenosidimutans TaxID=496056 RepID=A0A4R3KU21_9SPHI|nr:pyruvate dehydrogenase complex dihydrolipoamide acetyltransferase [Anseongella ginsenosidimutans]QEC51538.1 pyruvate dehydrogenase complex dihydrolipoamide acetyltransferase [Anseongella ginsenosidimutans]TCS88859.1 pyruvate dehydrogenase E2 component (dihydrolipoamide acetyltransferase) [Anseongella ginsenosidimutans]
MAEVIRMPKMSDTMTEGVLAKWHKKVGDKISSGDLVAEIETDKATMDFESFQEGTLLYIGPGEGDAVPVNDVIAVLGEEGEDYKALLEEEQKSSQGGEEGDKEEEAPKEEAPKEDAPKEEAKKEAPAKEEKKEAAPAEDTEDEGSEEEESVEGGKRIKASPLARKIAKEKGIDLSRVKGSAAGGRIVKKDVESYKPEEAAPAAAAAEAKPAAAARVVAGQESFEEVKVSQMRKTIARRLSESKFGAPHFYLTISVNMDKAIEARTRLNELSPVKISFNDLILKAAAAALRQHPNVNSSWLGDKIRYNHHINIGVAVAVEDGLLVPVVRFADAKSLSQIAGEVKDFAQKAKDKKLQPSDWEGSTFTISNLGMFGIEEFTAIINPPDACILAVGGIRKVPVVGADGAIAAGNEMKMTLSCDHRAVDGATGAAFLQTLKSMLEDPLRILV